MAKEIVSYTWCDVCLNAEEEVRSEADEVTIQIDTLKPRALALCETHNKELLEPLRQALLDLGQKVDQMVAAAPGRPATILGAEPIMCELCGGGPYKGKGSRASHVRSTHGIDQREYRRRVAEMRGEEPAPESPAESLFSDTEEIPDAFKCDVDGCGKVYDPRKYERPAQALGMHKAKSHGIRGRRHEAKGMA